MFKKRVAGGILLIASILVGAIVIPVGASTQEDKGTTNRKTVDMLKSEIVKLNLEEKRTLLAWLKQQAAVGRSEIKVIDKEGNVAYEGPWEDSIYPFGRKFEIPNPKGGGIISIPFSEVTECYFVKVGKDDLTQLDIEKIQKSHRSIEEHLKLWPLRIKYILRDGSQYFDSSPYGEGVGVAFDFPNGRSFKISSHDLEKVIIKRYPEK